MYYIESIIITLVTRGKVAYDYFLVKEDNYEHKKSIDRINIDSYTVRTK